MTEAQAIVAYLHKGEWFTAEEVQAKRRRDQGAFVEANPYTLDALRRRREYGRDVPEWVKLDERKQ